MRWMFLILSTLSVVLLAAWAYRENYATQDAQRRVARLQAELARLREERQVLRAEWTYLNRPERLQALALLNFPRLGLVPMEGRHFARITDLPWPPLAEELDRIAATSGRSR